MPTSRHGQYFLFQKDLPEYFTFFAFVAMIYGTTLNNKEILLGNTMKNITAVVLTYNGERKLDDCLASLSFCEQILVVDSYSADKTEEIAKKYHAQFIQNPFKNTYTQFEFAFKHVKSEWIFTLDQDEICSSELKESILAFLGNKERADNSEYFGAFVSRSSFYFGKFLKHSDWYPDYLLRLFRIDKVILSHSGAHEEFQMNGNIPTLKGDIIHFPYTSFAHQMSKLNSYAEAGALDMTAKGKSFSLCRAFFHAYWGFIRLYIFKKGFLDGKAGFILALHHSFYVFMKYVRVGEDNNLWEKNK